MPFKKKRTRRKTSLHYRAIRGINQLDHMKSLKLEDEYNDDIQRTTNVVNRVTQLISIIF